MDFSCVAAVLHLPPPVAENFSRSWEVSEKAFPGAAAVPFLSPDFIAEYTPALDFSPDLTVPLQQAAASIRKSEALTHLAWHLYHRNFLNPADPPWMPDYDAPAELLGADGPGLFALLVALGSLPLIAAAYRKLGLPPTYAAEQHRWLGTSIALYRAAHGGRYGHALRQTVWLRFAVNGKLFRIGRLEFLLEPYPAWAPAVYRRRKDGKLAVFARPGWKYGSDWRRLADNDAAAAHTAALCESGAVLQGVRLHYDGTASAAPPLERTEWAPVAAPWTNIATVHIPAGGGLTPELVQESLRAAPEFFRRYLRCEIPLFLCESWIMNPVWQKLLPSANITAMQRAGFQVALPRSSGCREGLFFVFGRDDGGPGTDYPADNSMRRAMLAAWHDDKLCSGGWLFPADAAADYGHPERF